MAESDSARDEAITAAREKATDVYDPAELGHNKALGLVGLTLTSPFRHLKDQTEDLLNPQRSRTIILRLRKPVSVPVGDRGEIERLVESAYLATGWTAVDELIHQAWFLSQSRAHGRLPDARGSGSRRT